MPQSMESNVKRIRDLRSLLFSPSSLYVILPPLMEKTRKQSSYDEEACNPFSQR